MAVMKKQYVPGKKKVKGWDAHDNSLCHAYFQVRSESERMPFPPRPSLSRGACAPAGTIRASAHHLACPPTGVYRAVVPCDSRVVLREHRVKEPAENV